MGEMFGRKMNFLRGGQMYFGEKICCPGNFGRTLVQYHPNNEVNYITRVTTIGPKKNFCTNVSRSHRK